MASSLKISSFSSATWLAVFNQVLHCEEDKRAEAQEYDINAIGVYVTHEQPDAENTLAGHVPIELSRLLTFFLQANAGNLLTATVTWKRKRQMCL